MITSSCSTSSLVRALHKWLHWCNNGTGTTDAPICVWAGGAGFFHIAMMIKCPSLCTCNIHMSEMSDSSGSGSFKASFVTVTKLAFERVSMAECIMGSHTSSMFGITNIFCGRTSTKQSKAAVIL